MTDDVHAESPYAEMGYRDTLNAADNIYRSGGDQLLLDISGNSTDGFLSVFNIALDLENATGGTESGVDCTAPAPATGNARAVGDAGMLGVLAALLGFFRARERAA